MDFVKNLTGGGSNNAENNNSSNQQQSGEGSSSGGGLMDKFNNFAGGGKQGEANEDSLDKGNYAPLLFLGLRLEGARNSISDIDRSCRLRSGKVPRPGRPEQRVCRRAGQGRGDIRLYPRQVQGYHGQ